MSGCGSCGNTFDTPQQFLNFVYKLPPLLEKEISVMEPMRKRIYISMPPRGELPTQVGTNYQKMVVHTPRFRSFSNSELYHSKSDTPHGPTAAGAANAHCTVGPFHQLNGLGYERMTLEHRRSFFRTCDFCVETLWRENVAPEEFFNEYMRGVREQLDDIMDMTHRNEYESRSQKIWGIYTSNGRLLQNPSNPYTWATLPPGAQISLPSVEMLYQFAEDVLSAYADYYMIGMVDGEPVYPLVMNSRTKHNLVFKNPQLIQFINFSSMADSLITDWQGPISKIGPFVIFVDNDATKLRLNPVTGLAEQIPHWIPIPAPDGGDMWVEHPDWHTRGAGFFDTISIPRKDTWKKLIRRIPTSIGGVDFGDEISPELGLQYINIRDKECNPFGWIGHFVASHEYYVEPGINLAQAPSYMLGVFSGIPGAGNEMLYDAPAQCPPTPSVCNVVDPVGCPCIGITCVNVSPTNPAQMFVTFQQQFTPALVAGSNVTLTTKSGGTQTVTVATPLQVSADGLTYLLEVPAAALANGPISADDYIEVACEVIEYCETKVIGIDDCRSEVSNAVRVRFDKNLRCRAAGDLITLTWRNGFSAEFSVVSANVNSQWYVLRYAPGNGPTDDPTGTNPDTSTWDLCCDRGMPAHACCVPTIANGCEPCGLVFEKCDGTTSPGGSSNDGCGC